MDLDSRHAEISSNLAKIQERIRIAANNAQRSEADVTLIAVTKTYPASDARILSGLGIENFGENRSSEGGEKAREVQGLWHFQGQIQSNKIKQILTWAHFIHSLDDARHISYIKKALPEGKKISLFLQVALDGQSHRGGASDEMLPLLAEEVLSADGLSLEGLMAVAPLGQDPHRAFSQLARIHSVFSQQFPMAKKLSAGMSNDFEVAIEYGATHVRVGSSILGVRTGPL